MSIFIVVEDQPLYAVAATILTDIGVDENDLIRMPMNGKSIIRRDLNKYIQIGRRDTTIVLVDLDNDFLCAPSLVADWFGQPIPPHMCFRIAVREVEAWLMADHERFSEYFRVSKAIIPRDVENDGDPKTTLMNLARRSRNRRIREGVVPQYSDARIGPEYNVILNNFVRTSWRYEVARIRSPSLDSALNCICRTVG